MNAYRRGMMAGRRWCALLGVQLWPAVLQSQRALERSDVRTVHGGERCAACQVVVRRVGTLADDGDTASLTVHTGMRMLDSARAAVWTRSGNGFLVWYLGSGRVQRVGRIGSGPGEYRRISSVQYTSTGDIHVADQSLRRVSILDSQFRFVRSFALAPALYSGRSLVLPSGELVANLEGRGPAQDVPALWQFSSQGRAVRSADTVHGIVDGANASRLVRLMTHGAAGTFWTMSTQDIRFEQWSPTLARLRRILWPSSGLEVTGASRSPTKGIWPAGPNAPPASVVGLSLYGVDTAMVVSIVARSDWRGPRRVPYVNEEGRGFAYTIADDELDDYFETRIDLVDLRAAALIRTARVPGRMFSAGGRSLSHLRHAPGGELSLEVIQVSLTPAARTKLR